MQSNRQRGKCSRSSGSGLRVAKAVGTTLLYTAMIIAILALWNNNAPQFIYVAF